MSFSSVDINFFLWAYLCSQRSQQMLGIKFFSYRGIAAAKQSEKTFFLSISWPLHMW